MSRLYDTVEPSVIDEEMLQAAVEEQGPKDEAGKIAKMEGIDFVEVTSLRLDFKNILKIDNLWEFTSLVKLQLDNNIIEKIEGLDLLVNIVWLDLSFNNIEAIQGLDKLTKLEDLTLYNNRISCVENMDLLVNLHIFSVGNNNLKELEKDLGYLRRFKKLKTLNMSGNQFEEMELYKMKVIAYLPNLEFLDYRLIDEQSRNAAYEKYQLGMEERLDNDRKDEARMQRQQRESKELELHKAAYVEHLNDSSLFDSMYAEDSEGQKLNTMPQVKEMVDDFEKKFNAVCVEIFKYGLKENDKRKEEVSSFWECVEEAKSENKTTGMKMIDTFMDEKKKVFEQILHLSETTLESVLNVYQQKISDLWDNLMGLELQLVDQLEEVIKDFERNMQDLVSSFIENVQGYLTQCRDLENLHHESMMEMAIITLEKVIKNEVDEKEVPEDIRILFVDKDTINNAVTSSHDVHLLKIDNKEDDIVTRVNQWLKNMIEKIHEEEEIRRNRMRVAEINHLIDHLREEIDLLDLGAGAGGQY
ncbi:dynein regulatory complex subunit 3-like [Gigantopelta aegis]|uniref:dynein regulatory complex subunit 3-like n=1 Tax=Gigantopelta aegis TaxID=1735272 RepID=UPI001B8896D5|nr:dynein regulatory complex subunit 3-like [Gigantopelta aegis]